MGVPLSQMWTVATYVLQQKLRGRKRYPLVLMLEPLFRCNLACGGCGKIQYPADVLRQQLSVPECLNAVDECGAPVVSIPGGEPLLQLDVPAIDALHARGFDVGVESNGTIAAPAGIDWLCVSPKADAELVQRSGDELKLVYPQAEPGAQPERFRDLDFRHFFLQPLDDENRESNTRAVVEFCLSHPQWRLSLQTHKLIGIP